MSRVGRPRRGISSLITTAILLTATVMMGTGLVNWSNTSYRAGQNSIASTASTNSNQINEDLAIENVWFGTSPSKFVNITLTNIGGIGLNVTDIKIINSAQQVSDHTYRHSAILSQKQNSTMIFYSWQGGSPINIVVTTSRGSIFQTQAMHP
jgi:archaellum component FlaF (FlaF/FlaG flagellin family)